MKARFAVRDLEPRDVPALAALTPPGWRLPLDSAFLPRLGLAWFRGRVAHDAGGVIAVAQGIVTGRCGWLGHIVVRPDCRNGGLGTHMTVDMIEVLRRDGCSSFLLTASKMGEPIYRRIGFRTTSEYVFLRVPRLDLAPSDRIRNLEPGDLEDVLRLDFTATDETRDALIRPHVAGGFGHVDEAGALDGFLLPSFGSGLVVARSASAGRRLLRLKHGSDRAISVVPAANAAALESFRAWGAEETARAPRMVLGDEPRWRPDHVFARGAGDTG